MCFPCVRKKHIKANGKGLTVNRFWKCLFNGTVYVEFRVCFAMAKYENDIFCYVRQPMHLLVLFAILKSIFIRQDRLNRLKQC